MSAADYTLEEISQALLDTIKAGTETRIRTFTAPDELSLPLPAVLAEPIASDFTVSMTKGTDTWEFWLYVLVSPANLKTAKRQLSNFLTGRGPDSIRRAISDNRTLGLGNVQAVVTGVHDYGGKFPQAKVAHFGAILRVLIYIN